MRVLIACEFSGVVRRAFRERGHDAWSCDLLEAEDDSEFHIQGDALEWLRGIPSEVATPSGECGYMCGGRNAQSVEFMSYRKVYERPWDLIVAHPPCTYLCNSGVRWLAPGGNLDRERHKLMQQACDLFAALYWVDCPRVCVENPVMHGYARDYLQSARKVPRFTQSIQPWQFGHGEIKRTCLWLRGLPPLNPTKIVEGRKARVHRASPGADRWKERSRTLPGIAAAMAEQWG